MMEYMEFEEKVDIDDLVLPPKPMKMVETEEENKHAVLESECRKEI